MVRYQRSTQHFASGKKTAAQRPLKNQGRPGRGTKRRELGSGVNRGVSGARIITKNTTAQRPEKKWSAKRHEKNPVPLRLGKKSGSEAPRASVTGQTVGCLRRKASKTPRKERLHGRCENRVRSGASQGKISNNAGVTKFCAPTIDTGISPLEL